MPRLTLMNIPDVLMDELREAAEHERGSNTLQVRHMVEQTISRREAVKQGAAHELKRASESEEM